MASVFDKTCTEKEKVVLNGIGCIKREKSEHIQITTNKRKLVLNPTTQLVPVILFTKYELSILYSCEDIFDEICGKKEKRTYTRKNTQENACSHSHDVKSHCQWTKPVIYPTIQLVVVILYTKYELSILHSYGDIFGEKCGEKKKTYTRKNKRENAGSQSHYATSHCQFTYKILTFYLETVAEKSITKNDSIDCMVRKKRQQI